MIAECLFKADGTLGELLLHPIELGFNGRDAERGIPRLAFDNDDNQQQARRILERLRELSAEFGTVIEIETVQFGERQSSVGRVVIAS